MFILGWEELVTTILGDSLPQVARTTLGLRHCGYTVVPSLAGCELTCHGWPCRVPLRFSTSHFFFFNKFLFIYVFIFGCVGSSLLRAGFLELRREGTTLCCSARASHCGGFSCCRARALGPQASVVVAHGLSCSAACRIFLDQGSNPCPLHWQADS